MPLFVRVQSLYFILHRIFINKITIKEEYHVPLILENTLNDPNKIYTSNKIF